MTSPITDEQLKKLHNQVVAMDADRPFLISAATLKSISAELLAAREALRPFAEYLNDGGDLDNKGRPFPDDQTTGWVYLTMADFRRASRALSGNRSGN